MQPQSTKQEAIAEITRRLVEFYQPVRIKELGEACQSLDASLPSRVGASYHLTE